MNERITPLPCEAELRGMKMALKAHNYHPEYIDNYIESVVDGKPLTVCDAVMFEKREAALNTLPKLEALNLEMLETLEKCYASISKSEDRNLHQELKETIEKAKGG